MIKLIIDDLTGKILGYTKVRSNTCLYKDDVLVEENELAGMKIENAYWVDGKVINKEETEGYYTEMAALEDEIRENQQVDTESSLLDYLIKGSTLTAAIKRMKGIREKIQSLTDRREELKEQRQKDIREYYLSRNRERDALLECKCYSATILLIKDENRYLKEWLDWHLNLGFEHVYIYDNGKKDHVQDVVDLYAAEMQQKITVIDWTGHHTHIQQDAYNHFLSNHKKDVRWGLFIDSDEFLRFTDGETTDVNTFLRSYEDYTEVWGYEVEYDANGQETYEDKPVRERFTRQTDVREGVYWKNFIQVNRIDSFLMHYAYYDESRHLLFKNEKSNQDLFVIDHYYTKSWEEWKKKIMERGGADPNYHKALREFFFYNPDMSHLDTGENTVQSYE